MPTVNLSQMKPGQTGKIEQCLGDGGICHRLLEMGMTPGTPVEVVRFAPLGDPVDIKIRGYHLSLRLKEAEVIRVLLSH